ncbi:NUDIX domain-containing protein [Pustulibacterium marinum]|uniref:NUDIX domain-containing protein n=1 Tax=Pustulibacterium marinum TaxID=1224947 RepID=A0A1I7G4N0_9FLAO|nr:NUDIX domain-containing protein [Pustulibacterium marinum]SFU43420.1 NUDIX domain-containing protein [Pustulibacterium marinum]
MNQELYKKLLELSPDYKMNYLPSISVDCVVFGFHKASLKVLLTRLKGYEDWMLPGGYLQKDEDLEKSASRILEERTGAKDIFLTQFKSFGKVNRSEMAFDEWPDDLWHKQRFLSIAYYALIDFEQVTPSIDFYSNACEWKDIDELPGMIMDHREILDKALLQLRRDLNYKPVGLNLLPEKFTMPELQKLYEVILGKELNRGNFYRKMKRYDILTKLDETRKGGAHKAPDLYSFNLDTYKKALESGFQESW